MATEIQQDTPRRRSNSPSKARASRAARGQARLGGERRQRRWTEAGKTNPHGQKREREEAKRLPHTVTAETAEARWNRATTSSATQVADERERIRVRVRRGEREGERGGLSRLGRAGLT
jgi:hypothetical protein